MVEEPPKVMTWTKNQRNTFLGYFMDRRPSRGFQKTDFMDRIDFKDWSMRKKVLVYAKSEVVLKSFSYLKTIQVSSVDRRSSKVLVRSVRIKFL